MMIEIMIMITTTMNDTDLWLSEWLQLWWNMVKKWLMIMTDDDSTQLSKNHGNDCD